MYDQARDALAFYLNAEGGRFQQWSELAPYNMPPYQISLTRYYGFGIEETDFNYFGPNLEFDGFGLFLWALAHHAQTSGDYSLAQDNWDTISGRIADPILDLIDPTTGLLQKDSSIWESHWNGRERHWTFTNITATRGLCDAADLAEELGDTAAAQRYREGAQALGQAILNNLRDSDGALGATLVEVQNTNGSGHADAAVIDAIAMGLLNPKERPLKPPSPSSTASSRPPLDLGGSETMTTPTGNQAPITAPGAPPTTPSSGPSAISAVRSLPDSWAMTRAPIASSIGPLSMPAKTTSSSPKPGTRTPENTASTHP